MTDPTDYLRMVLDPVRLAVLGAAAVDNIRIQITVAGGGVSGPAMAHGAVWV